MMKKTFLLFFLFLVACSDSHELVVELDEDLDGNTSAQKFHFNLNGSISFPSSGFTREIDIDADRFEIFKIKYVPIEKWNRIGPIQPESNSEWGQQGILVRIVRKGGLFVPDETIFEQKISHFYNPVIESISTARRNALISITDDLDTGLGDGAQNNNTSYAEYDDFNQKLIFGEENNYLHSLVVKFTSRIDIGAYSTTPTSVRNLFDNIQDYNLPTLDLSQAAIIFPYDSLRRIELKNF